MLTGDGGARYSRREGHRPAGRHRQRRSSRSSTTTATRSATAPPTRRSTTRADHDGSAPSPRRRWSPSSATESPRRHPERGTQGCAGAQHHEPMPRRPPLPAPTDHRRRAAAVVPYYDADPPRQFSIQFAEFLEPAIAATTAEATTSCGPHRTATAGSGTWFSIESSSPARRRSTPSMRTACRQASSRSPSPTLATGQSVAQFSVNETVSITMTSFGRSDEQVVQLAQSITVAGRRRRGRRIRR